MTIEEQITKAIKIYTENSNNPEFYRNISKELNVLPILFDWEGFIAIRPDCSFIYYDEETNKWKEEKNPAWQIAAIIDGSTKYKFLKELVPKETVDSHICSECNGTGKYFQGKTKNEYVICGKCFGLGWVDSHIQSLKL
jgi:hypothetical protein